MGTKFMVLRRELELEIFKFPSNETSRLTEGLWGEDIKLFDDFSEAKKAALFLVNRYAQSEGQDKRKFSFKASSRVRILKQKLSKLTEDEIRHYPF